MVTQNEDKFLAASHAIRNAIAIIGGIFLSLANLPFSDGLGKKAKGLLKKAAPAKKKAQTDPEQMIPLASADELENFLPGRGTSQNRSEPSPGRALVRC